MKYMDKYTIFGGFWGKKHPLPGDFRVPDGTRWYQMVPDGTRVLIHSHVTKKAAISRPILTQMPALHNVSNVIILTIRTY